MLFRLLPLCALLFLVTACADNDNEVVAEPEAVETMEDTPQGETIVDLTGPAGLTTLRDLVVQAGLAETLNGPGPFTVFAPTDEAFSNLPEETLASLQQPENKAKLAEILKYHVVSGQAVPASAIAGTMDVDTVEGSTVKVTKGADGAVTLTDSQGNTATVVTPDQKASNGIVHVIDTVLMPAE